MFGNWRKSLRCWRNEFKTVSMQLWIFSSKKYKNIEIGFRSEKWAVSIIDGSTTQQRHTKSRKMLPGSRGLLYCSENHTFTVPFEVITLPAQETISDVWPEIWELPFHIKPLGSPIRMVGLAVAKRSWICLKDSTNAACTLNGVNGRTVFLPNKISDNDWIKIIKDVGFHTEAD
jgi:hypothetical protein